MGWLSACTVTTLHIISAGFRVSLVEKLAGSQFHGAKLTHYRQFCDSGELPAIAGTLRLGIFASRGGMRINIPNQITLGRLLLTIVFFALLTRYNAARPETAWVLPWAFWLYLVAALTDLLDGYLARSWGQVTAFGRVVDPVVDKIMVCGAFIFFASAHFVSADGKNVSQVEAWMAVLILFRELLVSAIRSFSESQGGDFAANWVGKIKSFVQFTTVCVILGVLAWYGKTPAWLTIAWICIWATVLVTAASIIAYMQRARAFVLSAEALGGPSKPPANLAAGAAKKASPSIEGASV